MMKLPPIHQPRMRRGDLVFFGNLPREIFQIHAVRGGVAVPAGSEPRPSVGGSFSLCVQSG